MSGDSALARGYVCMCDGTQEFGDYANNAISVMFPFESGRTPLRRYDGKPIWFVTIDRCVVREVTDLWKLGIRTTESCCGHGRTTGYIAPWEEHVDEMVALGYEWEGEPGRPFFLPKTRRIAA